MNTKGPGAHASLRARKAAHARRHAPPNSWGFTILFILIGSLSLISCGQKETKAAAPPPVPVVVSKVQKKDVPLQINAVGTVEAYSTVSVKSQVAGVLTDVRFKEG